MDKAQPTKPKRVPSKAQTEDLPQDLPSNKYAPKPKIGRPTLTNQTKIYNVGLGNLTTVTSYGRIDN